MEVATKLELEPLELIRVEGWMLFDASDELRNSKQVVTAAVTSDGLKLYYVSDELQNNEQAVTAAVTENGCALEFASD